MKKELGRKTIRIAESDFQLLKQGKKERGLNMGDYLMFLYSSVQNKSIHPQIVCLLEDIKGLIQISPEEWDEVMRNKYRKDVAAIWSLLNG